MHLNLLITAHAPRISPPPQVIAPDEPFDEKAVLLHVRKWRWLSVKVGNFYLFQMNWVVAALASLLLWSFVIVGVVNPDGLRQAFNVEGQPWITQNFTYLYILTQDVWLVFLLYLAVSKYGDLKLGKENEKPRYNDLTWFSMIFCSGIAVGFYIFGSGEPLYFYRQPTYWKSWTYDYNIRKTGGALDDAQRANQSIFMALFHWGWHGWIPYILFAINVGVVSHRWGLPMTVRASLYPLIGEHIYSSLGDLVDATSMACTTFGVCTSLGLGAYQLAMGLKYMERQYYGTDTLVTDKAFMCMLCAVITLCATLSVVTGLNRGLKTLSQIAMSLCLIILMFVLFADNTGYLLNVFVQSIGYYLQYIIQAGFDCEGFQQLAYEFDSSNVLWGSSPTNLQAKLTTAKFGNVTFSSADCGIQKNPCTEGQVMAHLFTQSVGTRWLASLGQLGPVWTYCPIVCTRSAAPTRSFKSPSISPPTSVSPSAPGSSADVSPSTIERRGAVAFAPERSGHWLTESIGGSPAAAAI